MKIGLFVYFVMPCGIGTGNPSPTRVYDKFVYMGLCVNRADIESAPTFDVVFYATAKLITHYELRIPNL